jgi:hypothetical protein
VIGRYEGSATIDPLDEGQDPRLREMFRSFQARHGAHLLLQYCLANGVGRIGFHGNRNQSNVLGALTGAGFKKPFFDNARDFIRLAVTGSREAFDACRPYILFQTIIGGRERFWDGFGAPVTAQAYFEKDIIIDISTVVAELCVETFDRHNR